MTPTEEGRKAYDDGKKLADNPYAGVRCADYARWVLGFRKQQAEAGDKTPFNEA